LPTLSPLEYHEHIFFVKQQNFPLIEPLQHPTNISDSQGFWSKNG